MCHTAKGISRIEKKQPPTLLYQALFLVSGLYFRNVRKSTFTYCLRLVQKSINGFGHKGGPRSEDGACLTVANSNSPERIYYNTVDSAKGLEAAHVRILFVPRLAGNRQYDIGGLQRDGHRFYQASMRATETICYFAPQEQVELHVRGGGVAPADLYWTRFAEATLLKASACETWIPKCRCPWHWMVGPETSYPGFGPPR